MPTVEQLRVRLVEKLEELFQLDQPDLDFGFYRIMHARADEVRRFLGEDLPQLVAEEFSRHAADAADDKLATAKLKVEQALGGESIDGDGNLVMAFRETPAGKQYLEAQAQARAAADTAKIEADVYDHLFRFFERYYERGDFISRRYYTRETPGRAAPYAIPYNGDEIKLHWSNADQYYIKTAEHFTNFTVDLIEGVKKQEQLNRRESPDAPRLFEDEELDELPRRVHFRIVGATEGEHGNVKASEQTKRYFVIHAANPVSVDEETIELTCRFEYRPDPEKTGTERVWQEKRNAEAAATIFERLQLMVVESDAEDKSVDSAKPVEHPAATYLRLLQAPAPTGKDKDRKLLHRYLAQYTARNTMDYFIHKDLGGFLRRELDFYIKNEVLHIDDIEQASAADLEPAMARLRLIRRVANPIIDFLAQLEDFQKKLWLKKKFVVETFWCVSIATILQIEDEAERNWLLDHIAGSEKQNNEWHELGLMSFEDEGGETLLTAVEDARSKIETLPTLVLDTRHFETRFEARLLSALGRVDDMSDGVFFGSDNFQALSLMQGRNRGQFKCVYIDPPYNTGDDGFAYKDAYRHASWMTMVADRLALCNELLGPANLFFCSIDRDENRNLLPLLFRHFGEEGFVEEIVWQKAYGGGAKTKWINSLHEYVHCFTTSPATVPFLELPPDAEMQKYYKLTDDKLSERGKYRLQPLYSNSNDFRENLTYPIPCPASSPSDSVTWEKEWEEIRVLLANNSLIVRQETRGWKIVLLTDDEEATWNGEIITPEKQWQWRWERTREALIKNEIVAERRGDAWSVNYKQYQFGTDGEERGRKPPSIFIGPYTQSGTQELRDLFGYDTMKFPKPTGLLSNLVGIDYKATNASFLDYFAGSGTTAHAIINLNRSDGGTRKFTLVEIGSYFDTVLLPRVKKIVFSPEWKDGRPKRLATAEEAERSPRLMKVIRLESYEDTLNNLDKLIDDASSSRQRRDALPEELRRQHTLRYMLDVESRGSQSLLNVDGFADPTAYKLRVKQAGSDIDREVNVDLIETFNWLIGLRVEHFAAPLTFTAEFERPPDPELPENQHTRLTVTGWSGPDEKGHVKTGSFKQAEDGPWWFRTVEGWVPRELSKPKGDRDRVLIVWRKLTDDLEKDNLMLDCFFLRHRINPRDFEYDVIYVNGSNNLPNLRRDEDTWKVRLIEEDFHRLMWNVEDV